jgi:hypothetical protein
MSFKISTVLCAIGLVLAARLPAQASSIPYTSLAVAGRVDAGLSSQLSVAPMVVGSSPIDSTATVEPPTVFGSLLDLDVVAVPEPASLVLFGSGLCALALVTRYRTPGRRNRRR